MYIIVELGTIVFFTSGALISLDTVGEIRNKLPWPVPIIIQRKEFDSRYMVYIFLECNTLGRAELPTNGSLLLFCVCIKCIV